MHRAYDPVVSFESYARGVLGYDESDRVLPVPKLFFGYARDMTALFTFGVGAAGIVFPERTTPERIFELIERHRPTILVNVPTMMAQMLAHPGAEHADLSCLRLVVSSGEALPAEVHRRFVERFGVEVLEGIGSSELYHIYVSNRPGRVRHRQRRTSSCRATRPGSSTTRATTSPTARRASCTCAGRAWRGATRETRSDRHGRSRAAGCAPATCSSGTPTATSGTAAAPTTCSRWAGSGSLRSRSRAACSPHPRVRECAVVGHEKDGLVVPRAFVVATTEGDDLEALARELIGHVRSELSPHKAPRDVRFLDALPKTANGKVDRKALSEGQHVP